MAGRSHRLDFIIVGVILVVAIVGFAGVKLYGAHNSADIVKITGPDGLLVELPLDEDTRYVVETDLGTNTVVVENATVHIEDADCKNHDCMDQGTITMPGQQLICLPHELVVQIVPGDSSTEGLPGGSTTDAASGGIGTGDSTASGSAGAAASSNTDGFDGVSR